MSHQFYLVLAGAAKQDPALLMPVGSYPFIYDGVRNEHILDGHALTLERFNEAGADLARRITGNTRYRVLPVVVVGDDAEELTQLRQELETHKTLVAELQRNRRAKPPASLTSAEG